MIARLKSAETYDHGGSGVVIGWLNDDPTEEAAAEIARLRARVEVLEKVREAAQRTQECWGILFGNEVCLPLIDEQLDALRAALKEAKP
jgi:hypothetical protein